jgi:hypothetical protein
LGPRRQQQSWMCLKGDKVAYGTKPMDKENMPPIHESQIGRKPP